MNKHPKALYLINFVSMWECFSYYGMRVLLVLFMIQELKFNDTQAFALYALYTTLVEFGGLVGGVVADRFLGLKPSIMLGGWTIALGHICLAIPGWDFSFYFGLGLIIGGTSLFRSNIAVLLGKCYADNDSLKDAAYTLYYTGINIGGFLATICCGFVGKVYGWHAGFGLAAIGMIAGNIVFCLERNILNVEKSNKANALIAFCGLLIAGAGCAAGLHYSEKAMMLFPLVAIGALAYVFSQMRTCSASEKRGVMKLLIMIGCLIIFYACEEQLGSTLILFAERHVNRETFFGMIPSASLVTFNPLTILVFGPMISRMLTTYRLKPLVKIGSSFLLLSAAFFLLYSGCLQVSSGQNVSLYVAILSIIMIALGEILIGPTIFAAASKYAPVRFQGLTMGLVTMGFAFANLFSGILSQMMAITEEVKSLEVYAGGFALIGCVTLLLSMGILYSNKLIKLKA